MLKLVKFLTSFFAVRPRKHPANDTHPTHCLNLDRLLPSHPYPPATF